MRKKPAYRMTTTLKISDLKNANEHTAEAASRHKKTLALQLIQLITERFEDFETEIYSEMKWLDRLNWSDDMNYGNDQILNLVAHFDSPLNYAGFDIESVIKEWKSCKRFVRVQFPDFETPNRDIWRLVLSRQKNEFPNLCLLICLVFSISVSNSSVERCFNILTLIMSDRRLNLTHNVLVNVMSIKCNDKNWSDIEREEIIERAVKIYHEKRRITQTSHEDEDQQQQGQKRKIDETEENHENNDNSDSDYEIDFDDIDL